MYLKLGPISTYVGEDLYAYEELPAVAAKHYRYTDDDGVLFRWWRGDVRLFGYGLTVEANRKPGAAGRSRGVEHQQGVSRTTGGTFGCRLHVQR